METPRDHTVAASSTGIRSNGDVTLSNSTVSITLANPPIPSFEDTEKLRNQFIEKVNRTSKKECEKNAAHIFGAKDQKLLRGEAKNILPELARAEFYGGDSGIEEVNYSAEAKRKEKISKKKREAPVFAKEIHNNGRYILLVGAAGSGKTTLAKRYSLLALNNNTIKRYKMVHFVNIRDTIPKGKISPRKFLFETQIVGKKFEKCIQHGYDWIQNDETAQKSILLVFDGLDTAPWDLRDVHYPKMTYDDELEPAAIMFNILKGHLFPECNILLTSREYGAMGFCPEIRPDAVIAMRGLSLRDIKILVEDLGGDKSVPIWEAIQDKSQNLMQLCSNPLFLTFVIMIHEYENIPPKTFSGIIIGLVERHIRSKNRSMEAKKVKDILHKLKILSYQSLLRRSVVFSEEEIKEAYLSPQDVKDLVIGGPNPEKQCDQQLLPKDYRYFFCHQALQEAFAAQHVSEMGENEFNEAVDEYLRKPHGIVVRQFTCGILFNDETDKSTGAREVTAKKEKQKKILQVLSEDLKNHSQSAMDTLNLLISLRECGQHDEVVAMVKESLKAIRLSGIPLTPSDLHAVGCVTSCCEKLSIMQLVNCQLEKKSIEILVEVLKQSDVEITVFDVSFNSNLRSDSMYYIHKICLRGQGLNYWQCGFRQHHILEFVDIDQQDAEKEIKIESTEDRIQLQYDEDSVLDMESYNVKNHPEKLKELASKRPVKKDLRVNINGYGLEMTQEDNHDDVKKLSNLLSFCQVIFELAISESTLSRDEVDLIAKAIRDRTIESVNIYLCHKILPPGWGALGQLVSNVQSKNLFLTACSLEEHKLRALKVSLRNHKAQIKKLDVSRNNNMLPNCLSQIGEIVENCGTEELIMGYCDLKCDHLKPLKEKVNKAKLVRIDLSGNDKMSPKGYQTLGEIVTKTETKQLDISECDPSAEDIKNFKKATKHAQLKKLNISRNRNLGTEGMKHIAQMTGQYTLDELFIRQCELNEDKLKNFVEALPEDAKIIHLELGLYFMPKKPTTDGEIDCLIKILPKICKKLTLSGWDLNSDMKKNLESAINELEYRELQIVFDRGLNEIVSQKSNKEN